MAYFNAPHRSFISGKKKYVDLLKVTRNFLILFGKDLWERVYDFFNKPQPYVSQYSLRTEAEHALIRARLKRDPRNCTHEKGGPQLWRRPWKDYNVSQHTFTNNVTRVRCNSCGKRWYAGRPGWDEALSMVDQSTNHPSASERRIKVYNGRST